MKRYLMQIWELSFGHVRGLYSGDTWRINAQCVLRFQPMVSPILHNINLYAHTFFVAYRTIDEDFVESITGGEDGLSPDSFPEWHPTNTAIGSLWDYLGFPTGIDPEGARPIAYPMYAYNYIWNWYYRDENLQAEVSLSNEDILLRNWQKDYLSSALLTQQKGIAPAIPLSGEIPLLGLGYFNQTVHTGPVTSYESDHTTSTYAKYKVVGSDAPNEHLYAEDDPDNAGYPNFRVDLSQGSATADVSDLRLMFQIQKWMEKK